MNTDRAERADTQRLHGHDDGESLRDTAVAMAEEMAERHYSECYGDICADCGDDSKTPLVKDTVFAQQYDEFYGLSEAVESHAQDLGGSGTQVLPVLSEVYFEAFWNAAVDPDECLRCTT